MGTVVHAPDHRHVQAVADVQRASVAALDALAASVSQLGRPAIGEAEREELVHDIRRRTKRIRAALRLLAPDLPGSWRDLDRLVRAPAAALAGQRDADVVRATLRDLAAHGSGPALADAVIDALDSLLVDSAATAAARSGPGPTAAIAGSAAMLSDAATILAALAPTTSSIVGVSLAGAYRRARRAHRRASRDRRIEQFHRWRREVKRLHAQLVLLGELGLLARPRLERRLDRLGEDLGRHHDLAVLADQLRSIAARESDGNELDDARGGDAAATMIARAERCQRRIERSVLRRGDVVFARSTRSFVERMCRRWVT
jgi:CHAD domain-containing protein